MGTLRPSRAAWDYQYLHHHSASRLRLGLSEGEAKDICRIKTAGPVRPGEACQAGLRVQIWTNNAEHACRQCRRRINKLYFQTPHLAYRVKRIDGLSMDASSGSRDGFTGLSGDAVLGLRDLEGSRSELKGYAGPLMFDLRHLTLVNHIVQRYFIHTM